MDTTRTAFLMWVAVVGLLVPHALAGDLYVNPDGLCGGSTPCFTTIPDAVAAASSGDTIHVAPGSYVTFGTVSKSLTFLGANAGVHPAVGTHATEVVGVRGPESVVTNNYPAMVPAADGITVDGFMFTGAGGRIIDTYSDANNFHLTNCIFINPSTGPTQGVIQLGGGSHVGLLLDFNVFQDQGDHTLYCAGGPYDGLRLAYNRFNGLGDGVFWSSTPAVNAVVEGNEFDGTIGGVPGLGGAGLNIGQGGNMVIANNWFHDMFYTAFQVGIVGGAVTDNVFERIYPYAGYWASAMELWGGQWGTAVSSNVTISCNTIRFNDIAGAAEPSHGVRLRAPETGPGIDGTTIYMHDNAMLDGGQRVDAFAVRHQGDQTKPVDAESNWWGTTDGVVIAAMMEGAVDYDPWLGGLPACGDNILRLDVEPTSLFVQPSEPVVVDMDVLNLIQDVTGCQAVMAFDSTFFGTGPSDVTVAPGGGLWNELIYDVWDLSGDLDVAIGVDLDTPGGTSVDATIATLTLTPTGAEGMTQVVFRPDVDDIGATFFSDTNHQPVWPATFDSQTIVIDGTAPTMETITPVDGSCMGGTVTVVFDFADANPLADLELDIYRPGDTQATKTQVSFPAGPISPAEAATLLSAYGATIAYDASEQKWTLTIDTTQAYWPDGQYQWYIEVEDLAGNKWGDMMDPGAHPEMKYDWSIDNTPPVISNIVAEQDGDSVLCPAVAVQGVVDIYVDVVDSGCSPLMVPPTVDVAGLAVSYVDVSGDTYHYQVTVDATTANGAHAIMVDAADVLGHASQDTSSTLCVDKNQITGTVSFETLTSASYTVVRDVVFKATDAGGVVATWTVPVSFVNDTVNKVAAGSYVLTNVPAATTGLSAKTDWTLRQKTGVMLDGSNQAVVAFSLSGGDLNGSNTINILDYSALKEDWLTTNARGDINGDGGVQLLDYSLLKSSWFTAGDPD